METLDLIIQVRCYHHTLDKNLYLLGLASGSIDIFAVTTKFLLCLSHYWLYHVIPPFPNLEVFYLKNSDLLSLLNLLLTKMINLMIAKLNSKLMIDNQSH